MLRGALSLITSCLTMGSVSASWGSMFSTTSPYTFEHDNYNYRGLDKRHNVLNDPQFLQQEQILRKKAYIIVSKPLQPSS